MSDPALAALLARSRDWPGPQLWFADEQWHGLDPGPLQRAGTRVVSNRYDVARALAAAGVRAEFDDFTAAGLAAGGFARIGYRISKEKAVVHHLINISHWLLAPGGELWLAGARGEGIRTYLDKAGSQLGSTPAAHKQGAFWLGQVTRTAAAAGPALDERDYARLRPVAAQDGISFLSKPGLFGWHGIDPGSALLSDRLPAFLRGFPRPPRTLLDLGCGYGYLAIMAHRQQTFSRIVASDNNAAALLACAANFDVLGIAGAVVASDCGDDLDERFDVVLCNPPFHRGFRGDRDLTERFLAASARRLAAGGRALFVVNRFIPLEQRATAHFRQVTTPLAARRFKLVELAGPR